MIRPAAALAGLLALAACGQPAPFVPGSMAWSDVTVASNRAAESGYEQPFQNGPMTVIATENGDLTSWTLVPCQGGAAICGGGLYGPAGTREVTADYTVIRGLYGRTFWLSPGGDGWVGRNVNAVVPLAWDAVDQPVSTWEQTRLTEGRAAGL